MLGCMHYNSLCLVACFSTPYHLVACILTPHMWLYTSQHLMLSTNNIEGGALGCLVKNKQKGD